MAEKTNIINPLVIRFIACFVVLFMAATAWSGDNTLPFVDLDGDGFNDTPPVVVSNAAPVTADSSQISANYVSFDLNTPAANQLLSFSENFSLLQFDCRSLSRNRCSMDMDNEFGPGTAAGIVSMTGAAGVCSGGSCHR